MYEIFTLIHSEKTFFFTFLLKHSIGIHQWIKGCTKIMQNLFTALPVVFQKSDNNLWCSGIFIVK